MRGHPVLLCPRGGGRGPPITDRADLHVRVGGQLFEVLGGDDAASGGPDADRSGACAHACSSCDSSVRCVTEPPMASKMSPSWSSNSMTPVSRDRKSTRLNSSHVAISYAVFCLKKKMKLTCLCSILTTSVIFLDSS